MAKFIGRRVNIGMGKETTRGVATAPTYWFPKMSLSMDDKIMFATDDSSVGVIEDSQTQDITSRYSEGSIEGRVTDRGIGLLLLATLGAENATTTPEIGVRDHNFVVGQSAQHNSLTIAVAEPNSNSGNGFSYALGMIDNLDINFEVGQYATYKADIRANAGSSVASTVAFVAENAFRPQDITFRTASAIGGLNAASPIVIKKGSISIKKNLEDDIVLGNVNPVDRLNKQFSVEGTIEIIYDSRVQIDTNMLGDLAVAMRIQMINTSVVIGTTLNPTLTIDLARVKLGEVARKIDNDGIVSETLKFKSFYSLTDTRMITAVLRNTVLALY